MDKTKQPGLRIDQIFLVAAEFRHRPDVLTVAPSTEIPDQEAQVEMRVFTSPDGRAAGVRVAVRTRPEDTQAPYSFCVEYVALVEEMDGEENMPVKEYVAMAGATLLYPFLREAVANLTSRGRFGALWLKPFNVQAVTTTLTTAPTVQASGAPGT